MDASFVTVDLAFRLEAAEAAYCQAKLEALRAVDDNARGVEIACFGRTVLLSIRSRRRNPSYNRAIGFSGEDREHLDGILCWLRERDVHFWFDVVPALVDDPILRALADAGLRTAFF